VFGFVYSYSVYINIFTNTKLANKGTNNAKTLALLVFIKPAACLLVRMRASRALLVSSFVDHPEGHGVPVEVQQRMLETCKALFDLPQDQKDVSTLKNNAACRGYERAGEQILDPEALPDSKDVCEHMFQKHFVGTEFNTGILHRSRGRTRPNQFAQGSESAA